MDRKKRKLFLDPRAWFGALVAAAVVLPFFLWNAENHWATFKFNLETRQHANQFTLKYLPEFIGVQMLAFSPGLFIFGIRDVWRGMRSKEARNCSGFLPALSAAVCLVYFLWVSLRRRVGAHWPEGAWISVLVVTAVVWSDDIVSGRTMAKKLRAVSLGICIALTAAIHLLAVVPVEWVDTARNYPLAPDKISTDKICEKYGWRELGGKVKEVTAGMAAERGAAPFIITPQYGLSAMVSFYTPGQPESHLWVKTRTHGENYRFWDNYGAMKGRDALFVAKKLEHAESAMDSLSARFMEVGPIEEFPVMRGDRKVRSFYLVRCVGFDGREPVFK